MQKESNSAVDKQNFIQNLRLKRLSGTKYNLKTLHNACEKISEELYGSQYHFIYELFQNAEDNDYFPEEIPEIKLILTDQYLILQNNECGFLERDIENIVDIGLTNKETTKEHKIGEKGIGFKSVFGITDTPIIVSNEFQFGFNAQEKLGYITPQWIDEFPFELKALIDFKKTNIILPFKNHNPKLFQQIKTISEETLLFLRKIEKIIIYDERNEEYIIFQRKRQPKRLILTISENDYATRYKYFYHFQKEVNRPLEINEKYRKEKSTSILEIALPITSQESVLNKDSFTHGQIFSYFPISRYTQLNGLPFILQGDFILTADRNEIKINNTWNQWLIEEGINLIFDVMNEWKSQPTLKHYILNLLPSPQLNNNPFFKGFVEKIDAKAQKIPCILNADDQWVYPRKAIFPDKEILDLIPNRVILKYLDKTPIKSEFIETTYNKEDLFTRLHISRFSQQQFLFLLENKEWYQNFPVDWFRRLYAYLGEQIHSKVCSPEDLLQLPIILQDSGELTHCLGKKIYLPSTESLPYTITPKYIYYLDLGFHPDEYQHFPDSHNISSFFKILKIKPITPRDWIQNEIIPLFEEKAWVSYTEKEIMEIMFYLKKYWNIVPKADKERLKPLIFLKTKSNNPKFKYKKPNLLFFSSEYCREPDNHFESLLQKGPDTESLFISPEYLMLNLESMLEQKQVEGWRYFFSQLGIKTDYLPQIREISGVDINQIPCSLKDQLPQQTFRQVKKLIIHDYSYPHNWDLAHSPIQILEYLASKWNRMEHRRYISFMTRDKKPITLKNPDINLKIKTTWFYHLTNTPWIPTSDGTKLIPSQIYLPSAQIPERIFENLPRLDPTDFTITIPDHQKFFLALGMHNNIRIADLLRKLISYAQNLSREKIDFEEFHEIYTFLNRRFAEKPDEIRNVFKNNTLIFIPIKSAAPKQKHFYCIDDIVWTNKTESQVLQTFTIPLKPHYPQLKQFFLDKLKIKRKPDLHDYFRIFDRIQEKQIISEADVEYIHEVYRLINQIKQDQVGIFRKFRKLIQSKKDHNFLLLEDHTLTHNVNNTVFYNDHDVFYAALKKDTPIRFIKVNRSDFPLLKEFFAIFHINPISEISTRIISHQELKTHNITLKLHHLIEEILPYLLRFLFHKTPEMFNSLNIEEKVQQIQNLKVFPTDELKVLLTIPNVGEKMQTIEKEVKLSNFYDKSSNQIFLSGKSDRFLDYIGMILAQEILDTKKIGETNSILGFDFFISNLLYKLKNGETHAHLNSFLADNQIYELPGDQFASLNQFFSQTEINRLFFPQKVISQLMKKEKQEKHNKTQNKNHEIKDEMFTKQKKQLVSTETAEDIQKGLSLLKKKRRKIQIGNRGELIAFNFIKAALKHHYIQKFKYVISIDTQDHFFLHNTKNDCIDFHWNRENQHEGYDFKLILHDQTFYFEVKATSTSDKMYFPISQAEWALARQTGAHYHIIRIFKTLDAHPEILLISNPYLEFEKSSIVANPVELKLTQSLCQSKTAHRESFHEHLLTIIHQSSTRINRIDHVPKDKNHALTSSNIHHGFECKFCGKFFQSNDGLEQHRAAKHNNSSSAHICSYCHREFGSAEALKQHSQAKHKTNRSLKKKFRCPKCNKKFKAKADLAQHLAAKHQN